jgi:hypothetical protein
MPANDAQVVQNWMSVIAKYTANIVDAIGFGTGVSFGLSAPHEIIDLSDLMSLSFHRVFCGKGGCISILTSKALRATDGHISVKLLNP